MLSLNLIKSLLVNLEFLQYFFSVKLSLKTVEFVNTLEGSEWPEILNPNVVRTYDTMSAIDIISDNS